MSTWYLYLIECEGGTLYAGISTDVERRYAEHVAGKGARYTRARKPVRLVGFRECGTRSEALKAELAIKKLPKERKVEALFSAKPHEAAHIASA
ncbi:MAG TPA: GIY-YIG nuclease family protein [Rhodocyclaceae bacterium]|jgi:putative endonuclease|nr:GIY-YIG nuclease family protein [Rhodocyclaceae bacterium]